MKDMKLYCIEIGRADAKNDVQNWTRKNVLATSVPAAIKKVKLYKNEYVNGASCIGVVDA